jgi:hypothetical protein
MRKQLQKSKKQVNISLLTVSAQTACRGGAVVDLSQFSPQQLLGDSAIPGLGT